MLCVSLRTWFVKADILIEKWRQITMRNSNPKKNKVEVNRVAHTFSDTHFSNPSDTDKASIEAPVMSQPIEYSSLRCFLLTSSKT